MIGQSYKDFCHDHSVPENPNFDGAISQIGKNTLFMNSIKKYDMTYHISSPRTPNKNPTEGAILEIKKKNYRIMLKNKVPKRLCYYVLICIFETGNLSVSSY